MYGMINQAILEYFHDEYGAETAEAVRAGAGCENTQFAFMTQYPDEVSYGLIGSAAQVLGQPAEAILEKVGEYWVGFALRSDYGHLLEVAGHSVPEIVQNLDHLHTRVGQAFVDLKPPSFWCSEVTDNSLILHYASDRAGLGAMVIGLVRGLGHMLGSETTIEMVDSEHEESMQFAVRFEARAVAAMSCARKPVADEDVA